MADDKPAYVEPAAGQGGMSFLHDAAYAGDLAAVVQCIGEGFDVNAQDESRWTPLHWVVDMGMIAGDRAEIIDALVKAGANLDLKDWDGRTPLMVGCQAGNGDLVRLLLEANADLTLRDNRGRTALILAADYGNPDTVAHLVQHGADPSATGGDGKRAIDVAREAGWDEIVSLLSRWAGGPGVS